MKALRVILALILATVCIVSLTTCRRLIYYLEQVCKVYGTVTVAGTNPPTPIGSVEVFVGDYQYSELTNYYGDYEMEMAEGTWTIDFCKEGYEPVTAEVTLGPKNMRERLDVSMVSTVINLTDYWDMSWTLPDGSKLEPIPFYIYQTDSTLNCSWGFSGSIDGSSVILEGSGPEGHLVFEGTVLGEEISGTSTDSSGEGTFSMVKSNIPFGRLDVEGTVQEVPVSVHTDYAFGNSDGENSFWLEFFDHESVIFLWFGVGGVLGVGDYEMPDDYWWLTVDWRPPGGPELGEIGIDDPQTLIISRFEENEGIAGSFDTISGALTGSFDVSFFEPAL